MAITINRQPSADDYLAVGQEIIIEATTNNGSQPNFQFIVDIYVNSVLILRYFTIAKSSKVITNISRVLKNYVSAYQTSVVDFTTSTYKSRALDMGRVIVQLGERYGSTPTNYTNLAQTNTFYIFPSWLTTQQRFSSQKPLNNLVNKLLTSQPSTIKVNKNKFYLSLSNLIKASNLTAKVKVVTTFRNNSTQTDYLQSKSQTIANGSNDNRFNSYYVSGAILLSALGLTDFDDVKHLDVSFVTNSNVQTTNAQRYEFSCFDEGGSLIFSNQYGGYDVLCIKYFHLIDEQQRNTYEKETSIDVFNGLVSPNEVQISGRLRRKIRLITDNLTQSEILWIRQLMIANTIIFYDGFNFIPLRITETSYKLNQPTLEPMYNLDITATISDKTDVL
jgi:hypothetical protein